MPRSHFATVSAATVVLVVCGCVLRQLGSLTSKRRAAACVCACILFACLITPTYHRQGLALAFPTVRRRAATWLQRQWDGDVEGQAKEAELGKCDVLDKFCGSVDVQLTSMDKDLRALQAAAESRQLAERKKASSEDSHSTPAPANAAEANSYYHFSSSGEKFKSKWDTFDVDAELRALDEVDAEEGERKERLRRKIGECNAGLWEAQAMIDDLRGDEDVRRRRKLLTSTATGLMDRLATVTTQFDAVPAIPPRA